MANRWTFRRPVNYWPRRRRAVRTLTPPVTVANPLSWTVPASRFASAVAESTHHYTIPASRWGHTP